MKPATIAQLNQLNQDFYQKIATDFDHTRQHPWPGWAQLLPIIKARFADQKTIKILDIGCGNGRFGEYLAQNLKGYTLEYVGLDTNEFLLDQAQLKLTPLIPSLQLTKVDILGALVKTSGNIPSLQKATFDLVVAFGLIHHVPTTQLRRIFIETSVSYAKTTGLTAIAAWQFDQGDKMIQRAVAPSTVNLDATELEPNDFILPWERGTTAYRYAHLLKPATIPELLPQSIQLLIGFLADGKDQKSNYYFVLETVH